MKTIKQRATIISMDDHNKNFEVKITNCLATHCAGSKGYVLLPQPEDKVGNYFEVGDEIFSKN